MRTQRARVIVFICALLISTAAAAIPSSTVVRAQEEVPRFKETRCRFQEPEDAKITCGDLYVYEDRTDPDNSNVIRLHAAVIKARSRTAYDDPIIYLEGGPGGETLDSLSFSYPQYFTKLAQKRDLIFFDQRGVGLSRPALDCREIEFSRVDILRRAVTTKQAEEEYNLALQACRERLQEDGINLAAYNSAENASDVAELLQTLGYTEWNLYGISYGTRLALTVMRDHPEGVRSVVLDSTYPPNASLYTDIPRSADRAFTALFDGCSTEPRCNRAYPKLESAFFKLMDDLNADPPKVTVRYQGKSYPVVVTGARVMDEMFSLMYSTSVIPYIPSLIWEMKDGNFDRMAELILEDNIGTRSSVSTGMYWSVQCGEEVPFSSESELENADALFPEQMGVFGASDAYAICQFWDVAHAPEVENEPVVSDIPTLVLAGEYDPITPPSYGVLAAKTLSNSFYFEFPGIGHGASVSGICPSSIMQQFLENPDRKPSSACIRRMEGPDFVIE